MFKPSSSGLSSPSVLASPPPPSEAGVAAAVSEDSEVPLFFPSNRMAGTNGRMSATPT